MKKSRLQAMIIATLLAFLLMSGSAWSHGGGHGPATSSPSMPEVTQENTDRNHDGHSPEASVEAGLEEPSTYGNMEIDPEEMEGQGTYGIETDHAAEDHSGHEDMLSSTEPGLFEDPLVEMEPVDSSTRHDESHSMASHEQHVEPTSFESVSSDAPGHGVAVGLTVFVGLTFGLLTLIRPFEK